MSDQRHAAYRLKKIFITNGRIFPEREKVTATKLDFTKKAFTLIEVVMVIVIISVLYAATRPIIGDSAQKTKETVLKNNLRVTREVISRYFKDHEKYPQDLNELVEKKYLMSLPVDTVTNRNDTWIMVPSKKGVSDLYDIRSGAAGKTLENTPYDQL